MKSLRFPTSVTCSLASQLDLLLLATSQYVVARRVSRIEQIELSMVLRGWWLRLREWGEETPPIAKHTSVITTYGFTKSRLRTGCFRS